MSHQAGAGERPYPVTLPARFMLEADAVPVADAPADSDQGDIEDAPTSFSPITSQEQFDRIINDRLKRERAKVADPTSQIVSKNHYEKLKAAAQRLAELEQANMSELEREREARVAAEERASSLESEARAARLRAALLAEAGKADRNIVDPDAAISLLDKDSLELDDAGNPLNVSEAMDSLLKAKPYLVANNGGARAHADLGARGSTGPTQVTESQLQTMSPEQIDKAHREGRLNDLLGIR